MSWFDHQHVWYPKTQTNTIVDPSTSKCLALLIVGDCRCGAVRTIEIRPGDAPVVRLTEKPIGA